jgi:hypothetical protein
MFSYKKFVNLLAFIVSILTVNLLTDRITGYLLTYRHIVHPAKATAIGMLLTVVVLYPAFTWIEDLSDRFTKKYFKAGKNMAGRTIGISVAFSIAFGILFLCYLNLWFGLMVWELF